MNYLKKQHLKAFFFAAFNLYFQWDVTKHNTITMKTLLFLYIESMQ